MTLHPATRHVLSFYRTMLLIAGSALCICTSTVFAEDSVVMDATTANLHPFSSANGAVPPAPWRVVGLPKATKPLTRFDMVPLDGRQVLRVQTDHSYANLVHDLPDLAATPGMKLRWRWRLDQPLRGTDLRQRTGDDTPLKVCALFNMSLEQLGFVERNLMRVARLTSGENLPAATLCYVWDARLTAGTLLDNAFTPRMRMIVADSGELHLGQWIAHSQDLAADFQRAFGKESATVPPLQALLVGGDSDNTGGQSLGYVGDVTFAP